MKALLKRLQAILPADPATAGLVALAALAVVVLFAFVFAEAVILDDTTSVAAWWTALPPLGVVLVMALAGWRAARPGMEPRPLAVPGRKEIWALGAILVLGAVLRLYDLGGYPACVDLDTAMNGRISQTLFGELMRGELTPVLRRWAEGNETAFLYVQGAFIRLFGVSVASLRLPSAIVGVLTIAAVYLLGRQLFSSHAGLAAAFLLAISPWHIDISRSPKRPVLTPLFIALVLYFLCKALRHPPSRRALRDMILCGVTLGVGLHGYEAFRLVPLAVTVILLGVRLSQRRLGKGLVELAVVATWAMIMTLPIIVFALKYPGVYFHHVTSASAVGSPDQGSLSQLVASALTAGRFFLIGVPVEPRALDILSAPLFMVTPLFLFGLVGLMAARQGPAAHRRINSVAMVVTLAVMAAPILLTTLNLAPRRFTGLMVPYYLLAGGALVGILRSVAGQAGWGRRVALGAGGICLALLLLAAANIIPGMTEQVEGARQVRAAQILKYALKRARLGEVYLAPGIRDNHYVARFFLTHHRLWRLPAAWPLPQGPLRRRVLVITDGERWRGEMHRLYGAQPRQVPLELPPAAGEPRDRQATIKLEVFELDRKRVRKLRVPPARLARGYTGQLLVPRPGLYRFRTPGRVRANLNLGGMNRRLVGGKGELRAGLAGGLHHISYQPTSGAGHLQWRPPGASTWAPVPAGQLWQLPPRSLPMAPRVASRARAGAFYHLPVGPEGAQDRLYLQAMAPGKVVAMLDISELPLRLWRGREATALDAAPLEALGAPRAEYYRQGHQLVSHRLAATEKHVFVLARHLGRIIRYDAGGKRGEALEARLGHPTDIAAAGGLLLVADGALDAVLALDPGGQAAPRTVMTNVRPVSLAARGGRLAVLDRGRQRIVVRGLGAAGVAPVSIPLPRVDDDMTLSMTVGGQIVLTQPHQKRVQLFSPAGELLAERDDPCFLDRHVDLGKPLAAQLQGGRLVIMGLSEAKAGPIHFGRGK